MSIATSADVDDIRRHRWEKRMELPLTAAALAFLVAYAWPILDPPMPAPCGTVCRVTAWAAWALFAVDYLVRLGPPRPRRPRSRPRFGTCKEAKAHGYGP